MTNDIKEVENKFVKAMGSGVAASGYLHALMVDVVQSQDGRRLASAIARLNSKSDKQGAAAVRAIIGAILPKSKLSLAKDKRTIVLSLKDAEFNDEAMQRLAKGVERKLSLRSTLVKEVKGDAGSKPALSTEKMHKTTVATVKKRVENKQCTLLEAVIAERAALKELEAMLVASTPSKPIAA